MPENSESDKESSSSSSSSSRGGDSRNVKKDGSSEGGNSESTSDNQDLDSRSREEGNSDNNNNNNDDGVLVNRSASGSGGDSDEVMVSEDVGREDMFLDASEDLGPDGRESSAAYTEPREGSDTEQQTQFSGLDNGLMQNDYMVDEMERLRAVLDKTVNEKDSLTREYKDEIDMAVQAIVNLRDQMTGLVNKDGNNSYIGEEMRDREVMGLGSEVPLHQMIHECSMFLRELQDTVHEKDRKIGELYREATEVSVSREVVDTYMNSVQSLASEVEFQKNQYVDETANRMISSLASVVYVEELPDNTIMAKISHIEKHVYALIENYNWFLYETEQLRQRLAEVRPDLGVQNDYVTVFATARDELFESRRKEAEFVEKLGHLESKNMESMEDLEKHKAAAEAVNLEFNKLKAELEQEKNRYLNTKEKLSMAVTKGKTLVQQRDSLKQAIADKTSELDRCLATLQEKTNALEAAELIKEELVKSQISVASLQEALLQRDTVLGKLMGILSEDSGVPEGLKNADISQRIEWLVDERNALKDVSQKFHQLADALLSIDLPENFSFSDLESRLGWLTESFDQAKAEITTLQDEVIRTRESAQSEMDQLSAAFSTALVERNCLEIELDDIVHKFETITEEHRASSEKEQELRTLLEAYGLQNVSQQSSSTAMLVEQCLGKKNERCSLALESSQVSAEDFERMQILLYVRAQELLLCEQLLEEEKNKESELNNLLNDFRKASDHVAMLRDEKNNLEKNLERSEEKNALIREKLSMAVKKGKGLVQERENLKQLIDEKSAEIEKLKLELLQQESTLNDFKNQNSNLSAELKYLSKLEDDLSALKDQRDQFEKDLLQSNQLLQNVMLSIDAIVPNLDPGSSEPVQKVNLLSGYLSECQDAKTSVEQELEKAKGETATFSGKLEEANSTIKSLEDALLVAKNHISELVEEKKVLEASKISTEEKLRRTVEESLSHSSLFTEVNDAKNLLENALSIAESDLSMLRKEKGEAVASKATTEAELVKMKEEVAVLTSKLAEVESCISMLTQEKEEAESSKVSVQTDFTRVKEEVVILTSKLSEVESNISILRKEKEEAESRRAAAEAELVRVKEESSVLTCKLEETSMTNKSLEDAVFQLESRIVLLTEENTDAQTGRTSMESDLKRLKEEAISWDGKLQESYSMIKSLEDELAKAENNISVLMTEKLVSDEEISALNTKLNACMEELAGTQGSLDTRSLKIHGHLKDLEVLTKDESITSLLRKICDCKYDSMKEMGQLFKNFRDLTESSLETHTVPQEILHLTKLLSTNIDDILGAEPDSDSDEAKEEDISLYIQKMVERFRTKFRVFATKIDGFASFMNKVDAAVLEGLQATRDMVTSIMEQTDYLRQKVETTETERHGLQNELAILKNDNSVLLAACADAAQELHCAADKCDNVPGTTSGPELAIQSKVDGSRQIHTTENLLSSSRKVCGLLEQSEKSKIALESTIEELQFRLDETADTLKNVTRERSLYQNNISSLEAELDRLRKLCNELSLKVEDYHALESKLNDKEAEIKSLHSSFSVKEQETGEALLQASLMRNILDKMKTLEVTLSEKEGQLGMNDSDPHAKLLYIIDRFPELQHQLVILTHDNKELQSTVTEQVLESERLKKLLENSVDNAQDLEEVRGELDSLVADIESIVEKVGGRDFIGGQKFMKRKELVEVLEKLVAAVITESENSKFKVSELDAKLLGSQKVVNELSSKVLVLEDSLQARASSMETVQERSIFEAPSLPPTSEITEVEDVGQVSLAKPAISPIPSAAHVRTMRKGSSEHIALDVESECLLDTQEMDGDKGHVFKSLNASGFIPTQGKLFADRVDGIWVTGSRVLMSRPRARLGLIAYWLLLHIWLLGTVL